MAISTNYKYYGNEYVNILDVERIREKHVSGFTSSNLTMVAHAFDFMANLNANCCQRKLLTTLLGTHASLLPNFLGWQKETLISDLNVCGNFFPHQTIANIVDTL